jgi:hypothetical protein
MRYFSGVHVQMSHLHLTAWLWLPIIRSLLPVG